LTVTVAANTGGSPRTATVVIGSSRVTISQPSQ
jgi:hypothetical protein